MRSARIIVALAVSAMALAACSPAGQASTTPPVTAVTSSPAVSSGHPATRTASPPSTTKVGVKPTPKPTAKVTPKRAPVKVKPAKKPVVKRVVQPAPVRDPLTGGPPSRNPVIATKIDNTYFDVPQFGVSDADVVFVEQVEGGLTRLIGVFHSKLPTEVGPVRSVRSTDAQLLPAFGKPGLVFSGGAGGPLADLAASSIVDTSGIGSAYFRSDAASGTYNLHANLAEIAVQAKGLGAVRSIGFHFAATSPVVVAAKKVSSIQVVMQAAETDFVYTGGRFVRTRYGSQVSDYQGKLERMDNVLVLHIVDKPDGTVDSVGSPSYLSQTVNSGKLSLFRDGRVIQGVWKRAKVDGPFTFLDDAGRQLPFKPGNTWVLLAPQNAQVSTR